MKDWYEIRNKTSTTAEVWIYEEIGENFWGEGLTAKRFVTELSALEVSSIALHINSPGGSVFDGQAIYNALVRHPAAITTYVDGLAASIASVVALAGDIIIMPGNALMMIHDPWGMAVGYAADMRQMADTLDKVRDTILNVYDDNSTKSRDELSAAMTAETWLTAKDALAYGFIEEVAAEVKMAARFDLSRFRNAPVVFTPGPDQSAPAVSAEDPAKPPAESGDTKRDWVPASPLGRMLTFAPRQN